MQVSANLLRRAHGDNLPAAFSAFRTEVDHPVSGFDHIEVVLDHNQRSAAIDQLAECGQQLRHIIEVEAGGGLVENVEHAAGLRRLGGRISGAHLGEMRGQFHALGLAA